MGPAEVRAEIAQLAAGQWGLISTAQATMAGATRMLLTRMAANGELERVVYGVYATPAALADELLEKRALWLSLDPSRTAEERLARRHEAGVLSHATAAALHGIGDILDDRVEVTLPRRQQSRREELHLYKAVLRPDEVMSVAGLPVTTPARTIADLVAADHDRDHVATVLAEAVNRGQAGLERVRTALEERLGRERGSEIFDELLVAAGLDEASLERRVIRSPIGKRMIDETVLLFLEHLPANARKREFSQVVQDIEFLQKLVLPALDSETMKSIRRTSELARSMSAPLDSETIKSIRKTSELMNSIQRPAVADVATVGRVLGKADLQDSIRRITKMYASVDNRPNKRRRALDVLHTSHSPSDGDTDTEAPRGEEDQEQ